MHEMHAGGEQDFPVRSASKTSTRCDRFASEALCELTCDFSGRGADASLQVLRARVSCACVCVRASTPSLKAHPRITGDSDLFGPAADEPRHRTTCRCTMHDGVKHVCFEKIGGGEGGCTVRD